MKSSPPEKLADSWDNITFPDDWAGMSYDPPMATLTQIAEMSLLFLKKWQEMPGFEEERVSGMNTEPFEL
jgi:hypothetical protein